MTHLSLLFETNVMMGNDLTLGRIQEGLGGTPLALKKKKSIIQYFVRFKRYFVSYKVFADFFAFKSFKLCK